MSESVRVGTRASRLALWQANWVKSRLEDLHRGIEVVLVRIKTEGDRIEVPLFQLGGKGLFVKEIEEALIRGEIDLAVHSAKDLPAVIPRELCLAAFPPREDPRDVLVSRGAIPWERFPQKGKVGTSSPRRKAQLLGRRPDLEVVPLRGNLDTRIRKLGEGDMEGIIVASAGLRRLGWEEKAADYFDPEIMIPAVGQGVLAVEIHRENRRIRDRVAPLNHLSTALEIAAERAFLQTLGGGCQVPVAGFAKTDGASLRLIGLISTPDGKRAVRGEESGAAEEAEALGTRLARRLLDRGGGEILKEVYR